MTPVRPHSRPTATLLVGGALAALLAGCGSDSPTGTPDSAGATRAATTAVQTGSTGSGTGSGTDTGTVDAAACDLTDPATVTSVFGGTSAPEKPGEARNCEYTLTGGRASLVEVYALGSSEAWESQKKQADDIGGPLTPVQVGDAAYLTKTPPNTLYVKDGGRIFGVQVVALSSTKDYRAELTTLAGRIIG